MFSPAIALVCLAFAATAVSALPKPHTAAPTQSYCPTADTAPHTGPGPHEAVQQYSWWDDVPPETIHVLNVTAYMGRWFQMYNSWLTATTCQRNATCITATYAEDSLMAFNATGTMNYGAAGGPVKTSHSQVVQMEADCQGKWLMQFPVTIPISAHDIHFKVSVFYWIVDLGPINADGLYDYAVVSAPLLIDVCIFARNVTTFRAVYEQPLLAKLATMGFSTKYNSPLPVYQGSDCLYPTAAATATIAAPK